MKHFRQTYVIRSIFRFTSELREVLNLIDKVSAQFFILSQLLRLLQFESGTFLHVCISPVNFFCKIVTSALLNLNDRNALSQTSQDIYSWCCLVCFDEERVSALSCFQCNDWRTSAVRFEEAGIGWRSKSPQADVDDESRHLRFSLRHLK